MFIVFLVAVLLLAIYAALIAYYEQAWSLMPSRLHSQELRVNATLKVTVIVPARNEEKNILACLRSLVTQNYPGEFTEIIVVNDFSTDETEQLVRSFPAPNIRLINLQEMLGDQRINSYKKKAIEIAVAAASGDLIITTDADCTAPPGWIDSIVQYQQETQAVFIAAPVRIVYNHTFLGLFQCLDFLTLQGITGAAVFKKAHSMCNGANLAYLRTAFFEVDGFRGIDRIASGDDMLLMHKIARKYPGHYFFLKNATAIIDTLPARDWKEFFNQRIRWASKAGKYDDRRITAVLALVYLVNLALLFFLLTSLFHPLYFFFFLFLVVAKTFIEYGFVQAVARFFGQEQLVRYFFLLQPVHILYTVLTGFLGKFGSYEWKRRKVR